MKKQCENVWHSKNKYRADYLISVTANRLPDPAIECQEEEYWCLECLKRELEDIK